jgi:CBS domain containing-hemolysin-like protein
LMMGILGRVPAQGERVEVKGLRFTAEQVKGRRIAKVLVERIPESHDDGDRSEEERR